MVAKISPDRTQINVPELGPCWPWAGAKTAKGYGIIRDERGRVVYAHRVSLAAALGRALLPGMLAGHRCNWKGCVRPFHLYEATKADNENDKHDPYFWVHRPPIGEAITFPEQLLARRPVE
jgi:hypothetical protein